MDRTIRRLVGAAVLAVVAAIICPMDAGIRVIIALIVGVPSFVLMIVGRRQLGSSFSFKPAAKALVTSGLYSRIQHPMYFFLDLWLLAAIVALGWSMVIVLWLVLVVIHALQSRREERVLAAAFGAEYEAYQRRTWF